MDQKIDFSVLTAAQFPIKSLNAGEIIFTEGDAATEMFVIKSGRVEIRLGNRILNTLGERDIFGEMALIDYSPRSATAIAATDVALVPISEKQFIFMVGETPYFALSVMRVLANRLREMIKAVI